MIFNFKGNVTDIRLPDLDEVDYFLEEEKNFVMNQEGICKDNQNFEKLEKYKQLIVFLESELGEAYHKTYDFLNLILRDKGEKPTPSGVGWIAHT